MTALQERLAAAFRVEHREHLLIVRSLLDGLIAAGYDTSGFDYTEAYRRVHSLKGAARAVGLSPVESLAHQLETLMAQCQSNQRHLDKDVVALLHAAFDEIEDFVARWTGGSEEQPLAIQPAVERFMSGIVESPRPPVGFAPRQGEPRQETAAERAIGQARVETGSLDAALRSAGELASGLRRYESIAHDLRGLEKSLGRLEMMLSPLRNSDTEGSAVAVAEEISARALLDGIRAQLKDIRRRQEDGGWRLGRLSRQLVSDIRIMRIMPAETMFGGIGRMVRDLARQEGKQVSAVVHGSDTRVDREVLQTLKDPVMHLVRNAVSHGIELPTMRQQAGKPAEGRITLHIAVQRNHLVVRVEDDGAGLDIARIRRIAIERGILSDNTDLDGDFDTVTRLLTDPGFSTTTTVTKISGRGIGLSVVDQAVQRLQGTFRLAQRDSGGTEAVVTVPLAVIGTRVLRVRCHGNDFVLPVHAILRLYQLPLDAVEVVNGEPAARLPGHSGLVPLAGLAQILGLGDEGGADRRNKLSVVLLQSGTVAAGIVVDEIVAVLDVVIHGLNETLPDYEFLAGVVTLPDGDTATAINPSTLLRALPDTPRRIDKSDEHVKLAERAPLILVVDDSITTRTLEKSILESRGFRVCLGVDGVDAIRLLNEERPDLVITDVEMPRMDGFELLHSMKNDDRYADIPVILVTSRDDGEDKRKGLMLGATAYIVKQSFDQWQLLEAVEQIL